MQHDLKVVRNNEAKLSVVQPQDLDVHPDHLRWMRDHGDLKLLLSQVSRSNARIWHPETEWYIVFPMMMQGLGTAYAHIGRLSKEMSWC